MSSRRSSSSILANMQDLGGGLYDPDWTPFEGCWKKSLQMARWFCGSLRIGSGREPLVGDNGGEGGDGIAGGDFVQNGCLFVKVMAMATKS